MAKTRVRNGMPRVAITRTEFARRARECFVDELWHLPDVSGRPWRHDRDTGELVSGAVGAEGDDGSPGVRRWRQPRPDDHPGQGSRDGQGD